MCYYNLLNKYEKNIKKWTIFFDEQVGVLLRNILSRQFYRRNRHFFGFFGFFHLRLWITKESVIDSKESNTVLK